MIIVGACTSSMMFFVVLTILNDLRLMLDFALAMGPGIWVCIFTAVSVKTAGDMGVG